MSKIRAFQVENDNQLLTSKVDAFWGLFFGIRGIQEVPGFFEPKLSSFCLWRNISQGFFSGLRDNLQDNFISSVILSILLNDLDEHSWPT